MKNKLKKVSEQKYTINKNSSEDKECILKFSMCHDKYPMYKLNSNEIKEFISFAKKVENMKWRDIKRDKGLHYETLENVKPPSNISKDITLHSMRLSKKSRILGFKENEFFYIVWFDNNHSTC